MSHKLAKNLQTIIHITVAWFFALSLHFAIINMTLDEVNFPTLGLFERVSFVILLSLFFEKGILVNYLIGKYHKPRIEERIFMFLDLNNATTIAESIVSTMYSNLLSDFFKDIDLAITKTKGVVFQYVGDEVVVIWKMKNGLIT